MARAAEVLIGKPLMPWQRQVLDVAKEIDESTGRLAYREVVVTVMRQQGKTTLVLSNEVDTCVRNRRVEVAYTAQTGSDARKKLLEEHVPLVLESRFEPLVDGIERRHGNEAIRFKNYSRIGVIAGTASAGHGSTLDLGVIDEAFKDLDDRREQAMLPAMVTRPNGQLWVVSTQGTAASLYLNRKCELGRLAVAEDSGRGICYFEWSADPDEDPGDPATWWGCMPALGFTINEDVVRHAYETMDLAEFRRAMLNVQDSSNAEQPIPPRFWGRVQSPSAAPVGELVLGVEAAIDRAWSSLVVADGFGNVELVDYRAGTGWVPGRVRELVAAHGCRVVLDPRGPARGFLAAMPDVMVEELTSAEVAASALTFVDRVVDGMLQVRPHEALDRAVEAGRRRWSGDQWYWTRKNAVSDVSPLIAASMAVLMAAVPVENDDRTPTVAGPVDEEAYRRELQRILDDEEEARRALDDSDDR